MCAPRAPGYIVRPRRASRGSARPLNASVRPPIQAVNTNATAPVHRRQNGLPLRFRGPGLAVGFFKANSVHTVKVSVAEHHSVCEASCVNRHRSCDHKVPRSRAPFAAAWSGSARSTVGACSSIKLASVRRCLCGQPPKSSNLQRRPLFSAAIEESVSAKNPCQFLQPPACGSLTTHSSGPSYVTRLLLPRRAAAQRER